MKPVKLKRALRGKSQGSEPKTVILHPESGNIQFDASEQILIHRIPPVECHGLEIFACAHRKIRLKQAIDGNTRTITLTIDEAELLADRLPRAIAAATHGRGQGD
jgi:hypothetical protein